MIDIDRRVEFDAGHRVPSHEGKCKNPHGHRYVLNVHIAGRLATTAGDSQEGMVLDFGFLKTLIEEKVCDVLDHGFIVYEGDYQMLVAMGEMNPEDDGMGGTGHTRVRHNLGEENRFGWKVAVVPFVPTVENLARWVWEVLEPHIPVLTANRAHLEKIEMWETPNSRATVTRNGR
jgi:6-pyruvoyltetrahydropterin/6-carboxytetrahydropterin synthase